MQLSVEKGPTVIVGDGRVEVSDHPGFAIEVGSHHITFAVPDSLHYFVV